MMISAKVVADSISPQDVRLTTFEVTFHRWILAEFNTHRVLSRNFRSSRAVPVKKLLEEVRNNPAEPIVWLKNKPGMVGGGMMTSEERLVARNAWLYAARETAARADWLANTCNMHKQWANRLLEPFLYVHGVVTGTDWANFYALRRASDAQPEFRMLADAMWEAQEASSPNPLKPGLWHLPYVQDNYAEAPPSYPMNRNTGGMISAARCARVSLKPFDGSDAIEKDLERAYKLIDNRHMSPFEHQATPDYLAIESKWAREEQHGNLTGWRQFRKTLPGECVLTGPRVSGLSRSR